MRKVINGIRTDSLELVSNRVWLIVCGLVLIFQPLLAYLGATQLAAIGLEATPANFPRATGY